MKKYNLTWKEAKKKSLKMWRVYKLNKTWRKVFIWYLIDDLDDKE